MRHLNPQHDAASGPWLRWALNIGAVLGSLCLLAAAVTLVFGLKPLVFASGSMAPAIPTGSLALAVPMPVAQALPGQVVSVVNSQGTRVTHRVVSTAPDGGLLLKGDANPVADLQPYSATTVDRVVFSVPILGNVVGWFSQPWLLFVAGLLCAGLLYIAFLRPGPGDGVDGRRRSSRRGRGRRRRVSGTRHWLRAGGAVLAIAMAVPAAAAVKVEPTLAAWTGSAAATAMPAAIEMPTGGKLQCKPTADAQQADISWTAPPATVSAVASYKITVTIDGKTASETMPAGTTVKRLSMRDGSTLLGAVLGLLVDILSLLIPYNYPVAISLTAVYANGWESAPQTYTTMAAFNGGLLGGGKQLRC